MVDFKDKKILTEIHEKFNFLYCSGTCKKLSETSE